MWRRSDGVSLTLAVAKYLSRGQADRLNVEAYLLASLGNIMRLHVCEDHQQFLGNGVEFWDRVVHCFHIL